MAFRIGNREAERLARELAHATGETIAQAVQHAIEERLARVRQRSRGHLLTEKLGDIFRRVDDLPPLEMRTDPESLGFGATGLPAREDR